MTEIIFEILEDEVDGGFVASSVGAYFGIHTQAESVPELKVMIADALRCHFETEANIPKIIRLHYVKDEVLKLALGLAMKSAY